MSTPKQRGVLDLSEVSLLSRSLVEAERATADAETALKVCKETERRLREEDLPGAMQELGLSKVVLETGEEISVTLVVYASITQERKPAAHKWLTDNGFGGLIKTVLEVPFSKGELDKAKKIQLEIEQQFDRMTVLEDSVHTQTLKAFIKEQLAAGTAIPLELFGAQAVNTAKVKQSKT